MKLKKAPTPNMDELMPILIGIWRRFHKLSGPAELLQTREFRSVVEAVQQIKKNLETTHDWMGTDYFKNPDVLGAYLLYDFVVHYQQGLALIGELPFTPTRVLDLGSGPGAFAFAALRHEAREVFALDRNFSALQMAGQVAGRFGYPLTVREHNILNLSFPVEGKFDLIVVGHVLQELFPDTRKGWVEAQKTWLQGLMYQLTPQGVLLIVDNSMPQANTRLLTLRDQLVRDGMPVQAPCVWQGSCPALEKKNPCYAQREFEKPFLIKEIQRGAQINLGSLKMSYLMIRQKAAGWPSLPNRPLYRVISPPIETHAGNRFHLCGTDGKRDLGAHVKEIPKEARAFDYLKRGELISVEDMIVRQEHFDITLGSKIKIEAPLNKPLPLQVPLEGGI